jgi:membrane-associated phospholipid phosphatase
MKKAPSGAFLLAVAAAMPLAHAQTPSNTGQGGLISMPDARVAPEAAWRTGMSFMRPYQTIWSSVAMFPWAEASFRFTRSFGVPGFEGGTNIDYGDFKDKSFDSKVIVFPERGIWPSLAIGAQDVGGGTGVFRAAYGVASRQFGDFDVTVGYGTRRIDGAFGGVRWTPSWAPNWGLVAEYDAFDYKRDFGSALSGSAAYKKEPAYGVEYREEWWGVKGFSAHGNVGFNAYVSIPLERRELVPKIDEPPAYTKINPRPTEAQWASDDQHRARVVRALREQDFRDVRVDYERGVLEAVLTNSRISSMPRAVGRAARTLLSFAPLEVREIRVTYQQGALPLATYELINVPLLQRYFNGMASRDQLAPYVAIRYAEPLAERSTEKDRQEMLSAFDEPLAQGLVIGRQDADLFAVKGENFLGGRVHLRPGLSTYLNDPSGAYRFDVSAVGSYDRPLGNNTFLQAETKLTIWENVSGVTQPSNSVLPHVRTDVAEYKRASRFKLLRLLANKYYHPAQRVYARASAGIYEEMYSGFGGQVLYMPPDGAWGVDLAGDWVKQRDFEGWFGHRDYSVVTMIASLNYRLAQGVTATLRGGRFLAGDEGVRVELKRRFNSGWEVGAWYTVTNGKDITSPGTPASPYRDKGIFMAMPLDTLLTRDTQATSGFNLAPWTRDVGQMVASPGDLYRMMERGVVQMHYLDGLSRFGDREDDYDLPSLGGGQDRIWPDLVANDWASAKRVVGRMDWTQAALLGGGLVLASSTLDKRAHTFSEKRRNAGWMRQGVRLGNALPLGAVGLSALFAFDDSRPALSDAGIAALEASGLALLATEGAKRVVGRPRPGTGLGHKEFDSGSSQDRFHSFPSRHVTVMWAAVTPYAEEFDAPWLYGVAALTNAARVGSREHWLSDTVGGALLGYALGRVTWEARRESRRDKRAAKITLGLNQVNAEWQFD